MSGQEAIESNTHLVGDEKCLGAPDNFLITCNLECLKFTTNLETLNWGRVLGLSLYAPPPRDTGPCKACSLRHPGRQKELKLSRSNSCARWGDACGEDMLDRKAKRKADCRLNSRETVANCER